MKIHRPELTFKGARRYVHGTSLYTEILNGAVCANIGTPDGRLRIDLHRQLHHQADFVYLDDGEKTKAPDDAVAAFSLAIGDAIVSGWVAPAGDAVQTSLPYDENKILTRAEISDHTISLSNAPAYTPIEVTTCLAVKLHNTLSPPPLGQKWLLARVTLARPFQDQDNHNIALEVTRFIGGRFTDTVITASGEKIGNFNFLLGAVD